MHADVVIFAGELQLDRLGADSSERGGHIIIVLRLIFVAETAAHVLANDAHFAERQAEVLGDVGASVGDALGGSEHGQFTAVPFRHAHAPLDLGVVHML